MPEQRDANWMIFPVTKIERVVLESNTSEIEWYRLLTDNFKLWRPPAQHNVLRFAFHGFIFPFPYHPLRYSFEVPKEGVSFIFWESMALQCRTHTEIYNSFSGFVDVVTKNLQLKKNY